MTTPITPLTSPDRPIHPLFSVVLPTALTLAAVLGIGVWLLHGGGSNAPVAGSVVEQSNTAASQAADAEPAKGSVTELPDDLGRRRPPSPYVVYLVGSVEQADAVRRGVAEADAIRADVAAPSLTVRTAVVVIVAEEQEQMLRALGDADATRDSLGLPGLVVVDLRTPA